MSRPGPGFQRGVLSMSVRFVKKDRGSGRSDPLFFSPRLSLNNRRGIPSPRRLVIPRPVRTHQPYLARRERSVCVWCISGVLGRWCRALYVPRPVWGVRTPGSEGSRGGGDGEVGVESFPVSNTLGCRVGRTDLPVVPTDPSLPHRSTVHRVRSPPTPGPLDSLHQ